MTTKSPGPSREPQGRGLLQRPDARRDQTRPRSKLGGYKGLLLGAFLAVSGWLGTLAMVSLVSDKAPAQVVLLPGTRFLMTLPDDVAVLSANRWSVTLSSEKPGLARRLYGQGARFVLPAGLPGCLPLPKGNRAPGRSDAAT